LKYGFEIPGYDPEATAPKGCYLDEEDAIRSIQFFEIFATHTKGELAGKPFTLEPWQQCVNWNAFGWKNTDGTRRYREIFVYVPRKNGKSSWCAGLALMGLILDQEPGAEVYSLAADREQARLVFDQAKVMALKDDTLSNMLKCYQHSIAYLDTNSSYKPLSAEASTKHGGNTHFAVIDELHAQPNRELTEVIQTSVGARRQPMIWYITTADYARESICNELLDYAKKVRDGIVDDPTFLPVIFEATLDDDWTHPDTWYKANPNLGVSVKEDYIERQCKKAQENASYENTFKRLHLNIQTEQDKRWIQMADWAKCADEVPDEQLLRSPCWGGVDLSTVSDLSAFALFWPEFNAAKLFFWLPEDQLKTKRGQLSYQTWVNSGHICLTPGNVIDYSWIRSEVNDQWDKYNLQDVGCDPWNATHFLTLLTEEDGRDMVLFRQGFASMNEPSKMMERLVKQGKLRHGNNPVLNWMASNVSVKSDPAGNIKPEKTEDANKIDGIVALIMAIGRAHVSFEEPGSVYSKRGLLTL
jgi:phage terminase large subunit-like protein